MYYLVDLYAGGVEVEFDTAKELKDYMEEALKEGELGGIARYAIFSGVQLNIQKFYPAI